LLSGELAGHDSFAILAQNALTLETGVAFTDTRKPVVFDGLELETLFGEELAPYERWDLALVVARITGYGLVPGRTRVLARIAAIQGIAFAVTEVTNTLVVAYSTVIGGAIAAK
jgi:hypothetical protein